MATYRKSRAFAPEGFFECEGRGLEWLGAAHAQGGPRVVQVYGWGKDYLDIERVGSASPTPQAARAFGAALARMHDAGAKYFGSAPDGYNGTCYFGPLQDPVKMDTGEWTDPISYFADGRLRPMVNLGVKRGELDKRDVELTERVIEALPDLMGRAAADKPARIHGDLWSGNVMWTADSGQYELSERNHRGLPVRTSVEGRMAGAHHALAALPHRRPLRLLRRRLRQRIPLHVPLPAEVTDLAPLRGGAKNASALSSVRPSTCEETTIRRNGVIPTFSRVSGGLQNVFAHILPTFFHARLHLHGGIEQTGHVHQVAVEQIRVHIQRHARVLVAQHPLQGLDVRARMHGQRGGGVPQVVRRGPFLLRPAQAHQRVMLYFVKSVFRV